MGIGDSKFECRTVSISDEGFSFCKFLDWFLLLTSSRGLSLGVN